jgi:acyl-CoA synthetase (AMP-forming)/AMP-acid ligase II
VNRDLLAIYDGRVQAEPEAVACHHVRLVGPELSATPITLAQLEARVAGGVRRLAEAGVGPGDRVLLAVDDPHAFLAWFLAVLRQGSVAVPVPAIRARLRAAAAARLRAVCADCRPRAAVVADPVEWPGTLCEGPHVIGAGEAAGPGDAAGARPSPAGIALIQYTSGSTSAPRGVVVTHRNLAANLEALTAATGVTASDTMLSWLPVHHDMGLIGGLLWPLSLGMTSYVMRPVTFVASPLVWLRAIDRYGATVSVGPPSAYHVCLRHAAAGAGRLDLSSWRVAFIGAEPIDPALPRRMAEILGPHGMPPTAARPAYGLAEATLAVALPPPGRPVRTDAIDRELMARTGRARPPSDRSVGTTTYVSVGSELPGHRIRILDPAGDRECGEREVGEIAIDGPSVTPGYFGDARLHRAGGRLLRTGDLGYRAGGELFVVDRIKDVVIVGGQNYYPADVESVLAGLPGVETGRVAAFAVSDERATEGVGVAVEVKRKTMEDQEALRRLIAGEMRRTFGFPPAAVLVVERGTLPRTTSGKIRRHACRSLLAVSASHVDGTGKPAPADSVTEERAV